MLEEDEDTGDDSPVIMSKKDEIHKKLAEHFGFSVGTSLITIIQGGVTSTNTLREALQIAFSLTEEDLIAGLPVENKTDIVVKAKGDQPAKTGQDIIEDIQAPYHAMANIIHYYIASQIFTHKIDMHYGDDD